VRPHNSFDMYFSKIYP